MKQNFAIKRKAHCEAGKRVLSAFMVLAMLCTTLFGITVSVAATSYNLLNPISGTVQGVGYDETAGHYGIDLYPYNYGDPVYAVASGTIMYSCPRNHTREYQSGDNCCTVKIILDEPITYNGTTYVCAFYTHMSSLVYDIYCGYKAECVAEYNAGLRADALPTESVHVEAGELIGYVGKGNGATHLHLSFEASEADGYAMMPNSEYYDVFGWEHNGKISATETISKLMTTYSTGLSLEQLKSKYPEGKYWNGGNIDSYTSSPCRCRHNTSHTSGSSSVACTCNSFWGSIQCAGFALKVLYDAYGQDCTEWPKKTNSSYIDQVKPGDYIRYRNNGHSVVVIAVNGDNITVGECNWGAPCRINWTRTESKSHFKNTFTHVYVAPYALTGGSTVHTHSYSITEYEAAHPHKAYTRCSCGQIGGYTGATTYVSSCSMCNEVCTCSDSYAGTYVCTTTSAPLIIRDGHGKNHNIIGSIPSGASVTVSKANGAWAHVTYGGVSGYASMEYLKKPLDTTNIYPLPFKCFPLSDANHAADAYDAPNGNRIGYIYGGDFCTVKEVYSNGWCLVNCPWDSSTKDVYTWTGNFLNLEFPPQTKVSEEKATTYIRLGGSSTLGWVDPGDTVTIVDNTYTTRTQIIYPHTDGTYRCAWVDADALIHKHTPGPAATCTTPQVCTTCDAIINDVTSHTPGPAATCTTTQTCTVCGLIMAYPIDHTYNAGEYIDPSHPHKIYNICICGAQQDSGQTTAISSCEICNPPVTYEISFVTNGGSPDILPNYKKQDETITLPSLTKNGYSFLGWDTDSSSDTAVYKADTVYTVTSDATLYAVWKQDTVNVTGISLNKTSVTVDVGNTVTLTATVTPSNATNKSVTWSSSAPSVATVTNGTVTALKAGTATITATTVDGSKTATCMVTVNGETVIDADVIYTISSVSSKPGDTIDVSLSVASDVAVDGLLLYNLNYDKNALEFVEFTEYGELIAKSLTGANGVESAKEQISLGYTDGVIPNGQICVIRFIVKDTAKDGEYIISIEGAASAKRQKLPSKVNNGKITISKWVHGDFDNNGEVNMEDVVYFMNWVNFSWQGYTMVYEGDKDFDKDGNINMQDVVHFMNWVNFWWDESYDINW